MLTRVLRLAPEIKAIAVSSADCVYQRSKNPILGFELKPNYRNSDPDFITTYERTNAHGQRDLERTLERSEGVRRVLLLGDSVVEGHGLPGDQTISRQWVALSKDGSTEVLNFGVSAYCTLAEIELLETKGLAFRPDIVVVLFVENDFDNFNREAFALAQTSQQPAAAKWLFRHSHLFRQTSLRLNFFDFRAAADPVRWNKEAIGDNNVVDGFRRLRALSERENFQPVIAIWPRFLDDAIVDVPTISADDPTPVVEQLAALHGLPSVRLSEFFQRHLGSSSEASNPRVYYTSGDSLHPSTEGAAVAAAALDQVVNRLEAGELVIPQSESKQDLRALAKSLGKAEPSYARVYHQEGVNHLIDGRFEEALEQFRKALEEDPQHAGAHGNMGLAYAGLGQTAKAKACYQAAIDAQPDFVQAHFNLANLLLNEGGTTNAITLLERTVAIAPNHSNALNALGMEFGKAGQFRQAQTHLERAVQVEPGFSQAHNNLGTVYTATGQLEAALRQFKEAVRADPNNHQAAARIKQVEAMIAESSP